MQRLLAQLGDVACQQGVAGQQQVVIGDPGEVLLPTTAGEASARAGAGRNGWLRPASWGSGWWASPPARGGPGVRPAFRRGCVPGSAVSCRGPCHHRGCRRRQFAQGLHPGQALQLVGPQGGVQQAGGWPGWAPGLCGVERMRGCSPRASAATGLPGRPGARRRPCSDAARAIHRLAHIEFAKRRQDRLDAGEGRATCSGCPSRRSSCTRSCSSSPRWASARGVSS